MKFFLLSDNLDALIGMRLAGVEGRVIASENELRASLKELLADADLAAIFLTSKVVDMCRDYIIDVKLKVKQPLILEIPEGDSGDVYFGTISQYVHKSTGLSITF